MHDGSGRILVQGLSKNFGPIDAVRNLHFTVEPGSVTGFLGPNGSGKTTTLRMILGLIAPSAGVATINGLPFAQLSNPGTVVGAVLEAQSFHPGRTARNHLRSYAAAMDVPDQQADQVLELVGLGSAATRKTGGFSLGMRQRLALATALLGDPQVLVLDEPSNGLDPEGIAWLRGFLKSFAATGRTVLVSSHLLREMEHTVDHVVIVSQGQCVYNGDLGQLRSAQRSRVLVRAADPGKLVTALQHSGFVVEHLPDGRLAVLDSDSRTVADLALQAGVALYDMQDEHVDLEQLFFQLTNGQYTGGAAPWGGPGPAGGAPPWGPPGGGFAPPAPQQTGQQPHQPQDAALWGAPQQGHRRENENGDSGGKA
ncbi:ABC-2 type transport system ATP-binding protein [Halopolyspora algeriensis]|uniref:ABC-2 type transport system ATP-binding protein n=1 Tax=Halopolyspora algeriensis TaxID=1500506 RepID=A0A368VTH5_9ACTN|nr:ATP-binding cassette domain-containing protein [Halopolyspora algeriensis]RCW45312.1 ABC-2 type transport system ATP-binding protein [Halopolyspora algeriensis]TQM47352.1 ABC-2 type transport system ATP-binding protein [Halopolyspora algeriensis]